MRKFAVLHITKEKHQVLTNSTNGWERGNLDNRLTSVIPLTSSLKCMISMSGIFPLVWKVLT